MQGTIYNEEILVLVFVAFVLVLILQHPTEVCDYHNVKFIIVIITNFLGTFVKHAPIK